MAAGWVKVPRDLLDESIFQDAQLLQVWLYCQLKAAYKPMQATIGTQRVDLQQGQLVYGRKAVSERLHMTEGKLLSAITQLERMGKIRIEPAQRYSIITVLDRGWLTDIDAEW